jgi:hypothetical protein
MSLASNTKHLLRTVASGREAPEHASVEYHLLSWRACAQVRRTISKKSFLFNLCFENKRVRKKIDSGTMYRNVAPHAWSPLDFHHSEEEAK